MHWLHRFTIHFSTTRAFWVLVLLMYGSPALSQIDSLLAAYRAAPEGTDKAGLQLQIAWHYQAEEAYGKAIAYYRDYLEHAAGMWGAPNGISVLNNIAFCYRELGDVDNEIAVQKEILDRIDKGGGTERSRYKTLQQLSTLSIQRRDYSEAIRLNEELLASARRLNDPLAVAQVYNNLGYIYHLQREPGLSAEQFNKSYKIITEQNVQVSEDDKANLLINFAVVSVNMGSMKEAEVFLQEAYQIRQKQNDSIKIAQTLNYLATYAYLQSKIETALQQVNQAVTMLSSAPGSDLRDVTLTESYKLIAQIMLKKNDLDEFRKYNELFTRQQEQIIQKERRKNKLLIERHLEVERTRNEIQRLIADGEKSRMQLSQATLEREKREKELELQRSQLARLQESHALKQQQYLNKELENRQIQQMLDLVRQRSMSDSQQQTINLLEKEKQLQALQLEKRQEEIQHLESSRMQDRKIRNYNLVVSGLLLVLLLIGMKLYLYRNKKNKLLVEQNFIINQMNSEIRLRNEELTSINEQLNQRTHELNTQNERLTEAQNTINNQNKQLKVYTRDLEAEVQRRSAEIIANNTQLREYASQMEKFTYAISHNLRAPIARLLGLTYVLTLNDPEADRAFMLSCIRESALQVDEVIKDLSMILELKSQGRQPTETVNLREKVAKTLAIHEDTIIQAGGSIVTDLQVERIESIPSYIDSILYNLIGNALKFRSPARPCVIRIATARNGDQFTLTVSDNGIGMDLENVGTKLFGLYKRFNLATEGKGLGLYLVKSHVDELDGKIEIESKVDAGTTIRITFHAFNDARNEHEARDDRKEANVAPIQAKA